MTRRMALVSIFCSILACLLGALAVVGSNGWDKVHLGDLPTWVGAIGAIVAGVFAGLAFRAQNNQMRSLQSKQELSDRILEYQARQQAKIFAQDIKVSWFHSHNQAAPDDPKETVCRVWVTNQSDALAEHVACRFLVDGSEVPGRPEYWLTYWSGEDKFEPTGARIASDGASEVDLRSEAGICFVLTLPGSVDEDRLDFLARFTDEIGTRWERNQRGKLEMVRIATW